VYIKGRGVNSLMGSRKSQKRGRDNGSALQPRVFVS
jgi:hypothetical protein